jgi:hypothetical protein
MSVYLAADDNDPHFLCSNRGWGDFCAWTEELKGKSGIFALADHGYTPDLADTANELLEATEESRPDDSVIGIVHSVIRFLREAEVNGAEAVFVTNGMTNAKDDTDDEAEAASEAAVAGRDGGDDRFVEGPHKIGIASDDRPIGFAEKPKWVRYSGPNGSKGWKNSNTGEVVYGSKRPSAGVGARQAATAKEGRQKVPDAEALLGQILEMLHMKLNAKTSRELGEKIEAMSIADIQFIKKHLGIKGSGTKAEMAAKIADAIKKPSADLARAHIDHIKEAKGLSGVEKKHRIATTLAKLDARTRKEVAEHHGIETKNAPAKTDVKPKTQAATTNPITSPPQGTPTPTRRS